MSHSTFNIGKLLLHKDPQSVLHFVGVLTCSCVQKYTSQTKRNLITRLNEHRIARSFNYKLTMLD